MNRRISFATVVLILSGAGGLAISPVSGQSLSSNQVTSKAIGGSHTFNQGKCANGASGAVACAKQPVAPTAPQGAVAGGAGAKKQVNNDHGQQLQKLKMHDPNYTGDMSFE